MWTIDEAPDQSGRTAVITGANAGIGRETARVLASRGATIILACRNIAKGEAAADWIAAASAAERSRLRVIRLDLSSLASVRGAAEEIQASCPRLDLLINNAGVMTIPFARSEDGFELTFAINHLGHFALTGLLLEQLLGMPGSRVITISSVAHRRGHLDLDTLESEQGHEPGRAYDRSKLANLLFVYELQHRLHAARAKAISLAAHPGIARTDLYQTSSRLERALLSPRLRPLTFWLAQSAEDGALPTLRAALDPDAKGGDYYGPAGWHQYTGRPERVDSSPDSHDRSAQRQLWLASEQLSGISYPLPDAWRNHDLSRTADRRPPSAEPSRGGEGCVGESSSNAPSRSRPSAEPAKGSNDRALCREGDEVRGRL